MRRSLSWGTIFIWYGISLAACILGTMAAYVGPLTSESWQLWAKYTNVVPQTWDTLRAFGSAALALYALYGLEVTPGLSPEDRDISSLRFSRTERRVIVTVAVVVALVAFIYLPWNFGRTYAGLIAQPHPVIRPHVSDPLSFRQIWVPYGPYALYVIGLWFGIIFPVFFFLFRGVRVDFIKQHALRSQLQQRIDLSSASGNLANYGDAVDDYLRLLKDTANRYVPLLLIVITACLVEQLTPLHCSVLSQASDLGKLALWLLWLPASVVSLFLFLVSYDEALKVAKRTIRSAMDQLKNAGDDEAALKARSLLKDVDAQSATTAMLSVTKSGNVGVYFLFIIVSALIGSFISYHEYWATAFVPNAALNWLHHYFHMFQNLAKDPICIAT